ncbi:hypothetical protein JOD27_000962 [Lentzea nigeriaca]|nr:hypothetical protein [Lentzea nigeriaca]
MTVAGLFDARVNGCPVVAAPLVGHGGWYGAFAHL